MSENRILNSIKDPHDISCLSNSELEILADEIRKQIIETTSKTGGHVASSLGAVELVLACHSLITTPEDKLVFDVGHQSYSHMLLDERRERFDTLRQYGGVPGFPRPSVSVHDANPSGHASDSLSIAAGYALANRVDKSDRKVITIIGDASIEGGMAFEALDYIGAEQLKMIIILNDNEQSISQTVGALTQHLSRLRASSNYRRAKSNIETNLKSAGKAGSLFLEMGRRVKEGLKNIVLPRQMIYEDLGILCTSPIDGNNITEVKEMLQLVLDFDGPVLIHAVTKKGKGYAPAEEDPEKFHGIAPYNISDGSLVKESASNTFTDAFGEILMEEADKDEDIFAITAAMEGGVGLKEFSNKYPYRTSDVGICEQGAVGLTSGLALAGKKPVVCIYSTFLQRAIDQAIINVALENLNVIFMIDRAGLVGADGPTHHGLFDINYMSMIPNMKILCPSDATELKSAFHTALSLGGPVSIRYPRMKADTTLNGDTDIKCLEVGKSRLLKSGDDCAILTFGSMCKNAMDASRILEAKGVSTRAVDMRWAKPLDREAIKEALSCKIIVTLEDGMIYGGAGQGIAAYAANREGASKIITLGIDDVFVEQGDIPTLQKSLGLDGASIAKRVLSEL